MSLYLCPRWRNKIDLFILFILYMKFSIAASSNFCNMEKLDKKTTTNHKSDNDTNIESKEQVRDLDKTMSNTDTVSFHIRKIV